MARNPNKTDITKPTRQSIERLLREFTEGHSHAQSTNKDYVFSQKLHTKCENLEKAFKNSQPYKSLYAEYKKHYDKWWSENMAFKTEARNVRNMYLAEGLTPKVKKLINKLVAKYQKTHIPHVFVNKV